MVLAGELKRTTGCAIISFHAPPPTHSHYKNDGLYQRPWVHAEYKPTWIEEPTSPDDVLGHAHIREVGSSVILVDQSSGLEMSTIHCFNLSRCHRW